MEENYTEIALKHNLLQFKDKPNLTALYRALFKPFDDIQAAFLSLKEQRFLGEKLTVDKKFLHKVDFFGFEGQSQTKGFRQGVLATRDFLNANLNRSVPKSYRLNLWLINTAQGKQLDGIGDILGIARPFVLDGDQIYFGFLGQRNSRGFSLAQMRYEHNALGGKYQRISEMNDNSYKRLLRWKIVANNSHGTIEDIIEACLVVFMAKSVQVTEVADEQRLIIHVKRPLDVADKMIEQIKEQFIPVCAGVNFNLIITE